MLSEWRSQNTSLDPVFGVHIESRSASVNVLSDSDADTEDVNDGDTFAELSPLPNLLLARDVHERWFIYVCICLGLAKIDKSISLDFAQKQAKVRNVYRKMSKK